MMPQTGIHNLPESVLAMSVPLGNILIIAGELK